jgi:fucose 4-O-acetylase-like acetyltransferase
MKKRDKTIDNLRGLAMLWVIVVHVLYWGNFFENSYLNLLKSFCLFEMPLFFFVTGASNGFSKNKGYFSFVLRRYKRILIPYWVFAIICAVLSIAYLQLSNGINVYTAAKVLISWMIPIDRQITSISYLTWALWFVPVYLCVVLIIPGLKHLRESRYAKLLVIALFAIFTITSIFNLGWIQNVAFYSFWTYVGLFYNDIIQKVNQKSFRKQMGVIGLAGMVALAALFLLGYPIDMQHNKFPPNIIFGVFSVMMISLILLAVPYINKLYSYIGNYMVMRRITDFFSSRSMTIFLYQVFAFNLTIPFTNLLIPSGSILLSILKSILCFITTVLLCVVLALVFGIVEQISNKRKCEI